jgi:PAS domain S-box-containing protein
LSDQGDEVAVRGAPEVSDAHFRAVAEATQDAIITADSTGEIVYANPRAVQLFAGSDATLVGSRVVDLVPPRLRDAHRCRLARYLSTGEPALAGRSVVLPARRADGSEFPVELGLATWHGDEGPMVTAVLRDVSERDDLLDGLREELARSEERRRGLSEALLLRGTVLDTVTHDVRTALGTIRAAAEVLGRDDASRSLTAHQRGLALGSLRSTAERIHRLLDDLLSLERLEAGSVPLERRTTDLVDLVRATALEHREAMGDRRVDLPGRSVVAVVDPRTVERIVENLLLNAVRHTPPGSPVVVSVRRVGDHAEIWVDDSGSGIPEELRERVFDRFFTGPGPHRGGSGMGLSLVARLAALHGGAAWVEDSDSGGASVRVRLRVGAGTGHG